jgi:hypothetical protein
MFLRLHLFLKHLEFIYMKLKIPNCSIFKIETITHGPNQIFSIVLLQGKENYVILFEQQMQVANPNYHSLKEHYLWLN